MRRGVVRWSVAVLAAGLMVAPAWASSFLEDAEDILRSVQEEDGGGDTSALTQDRIADGLREALRLGSREVVAQLGAADGFLGDPEVRIPLPENLRRADDLLTKAGFGALGDSVETRMNRGAEAAMDGAGTILASAISQMTLEDARAILEGPEDAATRYLRRTAGGEIEAELRPVIRDSLQEVGALAALDRMLGQYRELPFVPDVTANLTDHATAGAMDGLFHYIANEEAAIRADPAKRTTDLLRDVFGG